MTCKELVEFIQENNLQDSIVEVSALIQFDGDHDCPSTTDISLQIWDDKLSIYVGTNLQNQ